MTPDIVGKLDVSRIELHGVADFLPYPFIIAEVIDDIHHNTYLNEKFLEEIGYSLEEIPTIEAWYEKAYPEPDYMTKVINDWDNEQLLSQQKGKVFVKNKSLVTCKNGIKRWYEVKASVINKIHVVAFIDLDKEVKFQEELKNINANNDRMLSILGHDLRSPVANLMSISSMAAKTEISNEEYMVLINLINDRSSQVLDLLDNTFDWAKLNFNAISLKESIIDFNILIDSVLDVYKSSYQNKNITFTKEISTLKPITSDLEIVTIIIRNLISNAIKFTPQNGIIAITSSATELQLSDSGIGISEELINDIMSNRSSSRSGTNGEKGSGIGLQLVVNLAEKINCKFTIESPGQKGTIAKIAFR